MDKYLSEVTENIRLNMAHMYKCDYYKMFVYISTPTFCETVKVKHIFHAASTQKTRRRWKFFGARKERQGRGRFQGSAAPQVESVVNSTLEIIDIGYTTIGNTLQFEYICVL